MAQIDYILNNLPSRVYSKEETSNLYKFLSTFAGEMDEVNLKMQELRKTKFIDTAVGGDLDKLGAFLNLKRFSTENDEGYRARIKTRVQTFIGGGTIEALRQIIRLALNVEPTVIEHYLPNKHHLVFNNGFFNGFDVTNTGGLNVKVGTGVGYVEGNKYTNIDSDLPKAGVITNFIGKISGSTIANGNIFKNRYGATLVSPSDNNFSEVDATNISTLNNILSIKQGAVDNVMSQHLFSFDIIRALEDKYGVTIWQGKTLLSDKIIIAKQIITKLTCNWWGYGSSPTGSKATLIGWNGIQWSTGLNNVTGSNNVVAKLSITRTDSSGISSMIQSDGFVHFLTYAEASNGTTASIINTDYIELAIELNSPETLFPVKTKSDLSGKVRESFVENPNIGKRGASNTIFTPNNTAFEYSDNDLINIAAALDGKTVPSGGSATTAGNIGQHIYAFDVVGILEKKYGTAIWQGKTLLADKVNIARQLITKIRANWYGYGVGPLGNKATFARWSNNTNSWVTGGTTTNDRVTYIQANPGYSGVDLIDSNGLFHTLAYTDAAGRKNILSDLTNTTAWQGSASYSNRTANSVHTKPGSLYNELAERVTVLPNTQYTANVDSTHPDLAYVFTFYKADGTQISASGKNRGKYTFTTPNECVSMSFRLSNWSVVEGDFTNIYMVQGTDTSNLDSIMPSMTYSDFVEVEIEANITRTNSFALEANKTTNIILNKEGLFVATPRNPYSDEAWIATVVTNATTSTSITDKRYILNPFKDSITNTASITIQIPYDFTEGNITLENVKDILKSTKAAGVALLIKLIETQDDSINLNDSVDFTFEMGFSGLGGENYIGGR